MLKHRDIDATSAGSAHRAVAPGPCRKLFSLLIASTSVASVLPPALAEDLRIPETHPRLFIHRADLGALRFRCGLDRYADDPVARSLGLRFGSQREVLDRLSSASARIMLGRARADDLWAPAMMHLAAGEIGRPDPCTDYVARELLHPDRRWFDLEAVAAFDWCFDAIDPERRTRIIERLTRSLERFDAGDHPANELRFQRKLVGLAIALVLHEPRLPADNPDLAARITPIVNMARAYLEGPLVNFCRQRGAMPTSGGRGVWEETNLVTAVELWRTGAGRSLWPQLAGSLGRALERYFYADTDDPAVPHGFIYDEGSDAPVRPGLPHRGFVPAVPQAIAAGTGDPIATWYSHRNLVYTTCPAVADVDRYQWVRLLYAPPARPEADRAACPLARDFGGGWIAMRNGWRPGDTVVLFDAGQPFWRARQHFDAGQFQVYRKGRLAIDSGDDVTFEAVAARGGRTTLAGQSGDWDHYFQSTIAHNCVTIADRKLRMHHYGRPWPAQGNQRLIGHDYDLSAGDIHATDRVTGRLAAFETNSFYSYAAADLTAAYWPQAASLVERRLLFFSDGALLVLDRIRAARAGSVKTWHLQLPDRPQWMAAPPDASPAVIAPFEDLASARQLHGVGAQAGVWDFPPEPSWLVVTQQHGRLFVRTLLPADARRRVVGGPMVPRQIPDGPSAGLTYHGGEPAGYEHRLAPATLLNGPNAAYVLGRPEGLGAQFGLGATWGRLDVFPPDDTEAVTFLHLLIPTDATIDRPPAVRFQHAHDLAVIDLEIARRTIHLEMSLGDGPPGRAVIRDVWTGSILFEKSLTATVQPNLAIPRDTADLPATAPSAAGR